MRQRPGESRPARALLSGSRRGRFRLAASAVARAAGVNVDLEGGVGCSYPRLGISEFAPDDVRALDERGRLVRCDWARHALASEAAGGCHDDVLRPDRLDAGANRSGDLFDRLDLHRAVADDAERDLLLQA